jgi:hypothetical protein
MSEGGSTWGMNGRSLLTRIGYYTSPWRPWAPAAAISFAFLARQTDSMILRGLSSVAAFILFLLVSADAARSFWEADRGPWNPLRHSVKAPITPFQVALATALALVYAISIIVLLASFFILPPLWVFLVIGPLVIVAAGLVAWHNVRLWSFQAVEFEEMLNEEKHVQNENERIKQMRASGSTLDGPP